MARVNLNEWVASEQGKHFCQCGCGEPIRVLRDHHSRGVPRFRKGHYSRVANPMQGRFGASNPNFGNGRMDDGQGYVLVLLPPDQRGGRSKYAAEHRLVMERHLGRRLTRDEQVHHLNGDKTDNRVENLAVCSVRDHTTLHHRELRKRLGEERYLATRQRMRRGQTYGELLP